jgi:hypothetical protein
MWVPPLPTFCRHNRLIQNCPICSREQAVEMRPIISSPAPRSSQPREVTRPTRPRAGSSAARGGGAGAASGLRVRRLARGADDGFSSPLVPGLRSSEDADRLAQELAYAARRVERLAQEPPGLYAEVADRSLDLEERSWLAFLIAYLCPLDSDEPFATIEARRTTWASGELPDLEDAVPGPRSSYNPSRDGQTLAAYRAWAARASSQAVALGGDPAWTPARRFDRVFERLALPGLNRDARFDFLVTLGRLGVYELAAASLHLSGENEATIAAKRALGIGDPLLLQRRAADLAQASDLPIDALDLGLHNWGTGSRATVGMWPDTEPDPAALERIRSALGLS